MPTNQHEQIAQALRTLARQEIPDDMNLLPLIQTQFRQATARVHRAHGWTTLLIIGLMFSIVASVSALLLQNLPVDPGIEAVRAADLVTDINQTVTIADVTVTLNWAYADGQRVAFGYSVDTAAESDAVFYNAGVRMQDEAESFTHRFLGQILGAGGHAQLLDNGRSEYAASYNVTFAPDAPDTLAVTLALTLAPQPTGDTLPSGFGVGGEFTQDTLNLSGRYGIELAPDNRTLGTIGPFEFQFSLPYYPITPLSVDQTVSANGYTVTLESFQLAPSMTTARLCYTLPAAGDWLPVPTLIIDNQRVELAEFALQTETASTDPRVRCARIGFYASISAEAQVQLRVDRLEYRTFPPALPEADTGWEVFTPAPDEAIGWLPAETSRAVIRGPWLFEVTVR